MGDFLLAIVANRNSAGSQIVIVLSDSKNMNNLLPILGQARYGIGVVDKIPSINTFENSSE
jgi:cyclophilin family peptidyl-prolyl cis-trans isomerase